MRHTSHSWRLECTSVFNIEDQLGDHLDAGYSLADALANYLRGTAMDDAAQPGVESVLARGGLSVEPGAFPKGKLLVVGYGSYRLEDAERHLADAEAEEPSLTGMARAGPSVGPS